MSTLIHTVIVKDPEDQILQVVACFSERQVEITKRNVKIEWPNSHIVVKISPHEHHQ